MRSTWFLVAGLVLLAAGVIGMIVLGVLGALTPVAVQTTTSTTPTPTVTTQSSAAVGEQIYVTGATSTGPVLSSGGPVWFQRMRGGCALCHGADGRGRTIQMMGTVTDAPDIRYATLTQVGSVEPSATVGPWTDSDIVLAVRDGIEPDGSRLSADMPLWVLDDAQAQALLDYLKELR